MLCMPTLQSCSVDKIGAAFTNSTQNINVFSSILFLASKISPQLRFVVLLKDNNRVEWRVGPLTVPATSSGPTGQALHHGTSSYLGLCNIRIRNYGVIVLLINKLKFMDQISLTDLSPQKKERLVWLAMCHLQLNEIWEVSKVWWEQAGEVLPLEESAKMEQRKR